MAVEELGSLLVDLIDGFAWVFCEYVVPHLDLRDLNALMRTCKRLHRLIDDDQTIWRALIKSHDVPWKVMHFVAQDTGSFGIRCMLDEAMQCVAPFVRKEETSSGAGKEVLVDAKGLAKYVALENKKRRYGIIDIGCLVLSRGNDDTSEEENNE